MAEWVTHVDTVSLVPTIDINFDLQAKYGCDSHIGKCNLEFTQR